MNNMKTKNKVIKARQKTLFFRSFPLWAVYLMCLFLGFDLGVILAKFIFPILK